MRAKEIMMSNQAEPIDSPTGWVREHARQYIESYNEYQTKTEREIPVVILERI